VLAAEEGGETRDPGSGGHPGGLDSGHQTGSIQKPWTKDGGKERSGGQELLGTARIAYVGDGRPGALKPTVYPAKFWCRHRIRAEGCFSPF
jgi:hypothetical protein